MEARFGKIILVVSLLISASCDQFEPRGFFLSYESADERFEQSMAWNKNHPIREVVVPNDEYSIFAMADSHVGATNNLDYFLTEAKEDSAAAMVMVGDLTTGHAEDFAILEQHLLDQDPTNPFLVVGNHDLYFDGWKQFYSLFGSSTYRFTVVTPQASDLFICLDTGSGTLGNDQLNWLKNILASERSNYRYCVLFTHNNLFRIRHTTSTNPLVEELRVLLELLINYNVDMMVAGHDHQKNVVKFGNTTHITLDALLDNFKDAGYLKLSIDQSAIGFEFVNL